MGKKIEDIFVTMQLDVSFQDVARAVQEKGRFYSEVTFKNKKGQVMYGELTIMYHVDSIGKILGSTIICHDITENKKIQVQIEKQNDLLAAMLESSDGPISSVDHNYRYTSFNKQHAEVMKKLYNADIKIGANILDYHTNLSDRAAAKENIDKALKGELIVIESYAGVDKQSRRYFEIAHNPIRNANSEVTGVAVFARDVTERKNADLELRRTFEVLEKVGEGVDAGLAVIGSDYRVVWANKRLKDLGVAPNKKCYQTFNRSETICPDCGVKKVFEQNVSLDVHEYKTVNSKGETVWVELRVTPLKGKDGNVTAALELAVPITERKKAEEVIKFQANLLNHVGQAIIMVDNNRTIRFWNNAAEKLYGWSEEQALGYKVTELLGGVSPEEVDEVTKRLMADESWSTEVLAKTRDGSVVPIILNRTPIFNEDGEFVGATSITTDITLQKNTEAELTFSLNSLSNSLDKIQELNEKLRVVGGLTRHDVRNKLSAVTGYAYLLKKKHGDQADIVDGLGKMEQAVKETVRIFDFAKMYEQLGVEELIHINVEAKLNEASTLFAGSLPKIINECHGLTVLADSFLRQLFYNFIDNTKKYGKKTTTIKVHYEKTNQDSLKLVYEDDGVGVPFENKTHLFKEGFSTGGNTGFGLFLTKKMMDVYGWEIEENGEPGIGAKFTITIPKVNQNGKENFQIAQ